MVDKEEIKKEAKQIMDNFMQALFDIDVEEDFLLERKSCYREEKNGDLPDNDFKQRFLSNARKTSGDAVLANKGEWV
ncbi:MAG: hypothetical protein PF569_06225 [Candidatus Woesearchaeota archaeon]|jgi:hypothetical protein|nr:hypothetical protein [Candidatus Woesearchaeota archaeon]